MNGRISLYLAIAASVLIHLALIAYLDSRKEEAEAEKIREVTFVDMSYPPGAQKVIKKSPIVSENPDILSLLAGRSEEKEAPPPAIEKIHVAEETAPEPIETPKIDLDGHKKLETQALIDLEKVEPVAGIPVEDVIALSTDESKLKSTAEILKEEPVKLEKRTAPVGSGGLVSLSGQAGIEKKIELEKTYVPEKKKEIKIEEKKQLKPLPAQRKAKSSLSIGGEVKDRKIFRKVLPEYPVRAKRKGISGTVVVRFLVLPSGEVKGSSIFVESSSGYPELDDAVINALKRWRFEPLPEALKDKIQWGILVVKFVLK